MSKIERKYREQFKTDEDWKEYQRERKARNKREQRQRDREKADISQAIQQKFEQVFMKCKNLLFGNKKSIFRKYREGIYNGIGSVNYSQFITLTCKHTINLNTLIKATRVFVNALYNSQVISNYFFVFEHEGDNYHVHLLVESLNDNLLISEVRKWELGNRKIVEVKDKQSKIDHIYYMTKMLNPLKRDRVTQRLIDSWEIYYAPSKALLAETKHRPINNFQLFLKSLITALQGIFKTDNLPFLKQYTYATNIN